MKRVFETRSFCETLCQRIEDRPPIDETYIIVSRDDLLRAALVERLSDKPRLKIVKSLEEVRNEINFLVAPIDAETAQALSLKANELFKSAGLWNTFHAPLVAEFSGVLAQAPFGITDVQMLNHWLSTPVFIEKIGSRVRFACRYTYARSGQSWVPELPRLPLPPGDFAAGNGLLSGLSLLGSGNAASDNRGEQSEMALPGLSAVQPFAFSSPNPGNALNSLALGRWERVELPPSLSFSFIWSVEYASGGHISDARAERILQEPF